MQDFAAMAMYKLATHHTEGATAVYESHFTARAETFTDHDRRTADAAAAPALLTIVRALTRPFRRPAVSHPRALIRQPPDASGTVRTPGWTPSGHVQVSPTASTWKRQPDRGYRCTDASAS